MKKTESALYQRTWARMGLMFRSAMLQSLARFLLVLLLSFIHASCSEPSKTPSGKSKVAAPSPTPVTGRFAFQRMYIQARTWAVDAQPLRISSFNLKEVASKAGKCGAWQATFVSPQLGKARSYTFSSADSHGKIREGVFAGREEPWGGSSGQARPFFIQALKVDSDEAFDTASQKSSDFVIKNPEMPVLFQLELTSRHPNPTWRVIWGETLGTIHHSAFIDASSGVFLPGLR